MLQEITQAPNELHSEKRNGFRAAGEDVVHNVVVFAKILDVSAGAVDERDGIVDEDAMRVREIKVLIGEVVDCVIDLNDGSVDAVSDQGGGSGANPQTTEVIVSY